MRKIITLSFILYSLAGFSQQNHSPLDLENFAKEQGKIILELVNLTPEEASAFLPLYYEMVKKRFEVNVEIRKKMKHIGRNTNTTETEFQKIIDEQFAAKEKVTAIEKEYYVKFSKALPASKIFKICVAEVRMTKEMLKQHDKRQQEIKSKN
ncbi:MAG: hypothetical protein LBD45_08650 [Bacteroidales bacterium]|jgi:hypothetical protein|nr:hypothetical protein [Bacteroidales bacterium]